MASTSRVHVHDSVNIGLISELIPSTFMQSGDPEILNCVAYAAEFAIPATGQHCSPQHTLDQDSSQSVQTCLTCGKAAASRFAA